MKTARHQKQPIGPNGERLCRWCKVQIKPPKRTFCGDPKCVHEWRLRTSSSYMRKCVKKRDKGICAICKLDCKLFIIVLRNLFLTNKAEYEVQLKGIKLSPRRLYNSIWDADHIVPVCEGGGQCGLENIRTLCVWCHKVVTAELMVKIRSKKSHVKWVKEKVKSKLKK